MENLPLELRNSYFPRSSWSLPALSFSARRGLGHRRAVELLLALSQAAIVESANAEPLEVRPLGKGNITMSSRGCFDT